MTFSLSVFLIIYFVFLFILAIFVYFDLYHIIKWGGLNLTTFIFTFIFLAGLVLILFISFQYIHQIDWNQQITILKEINLSSPL